ncbi:MAG: CocE/NonD family hydrolase, partial [Terriglobales bacterium]
YLDSAGGSAGDVFHSGTMSERKPGSSPPDRYTYDPLDVRPADLEREDVKNYITDQRDALNLFGNGLVYHSEPFPEATEVSGVMKFVAWIALDVPDTDFQVSVSEVLADGSSVALASDVMRARYRESLRQQKLIKPGEILRYEFDGFFFFSRRISQGSRLRLVFKSPNSIYLQKNYNSGGVVNEESGKDARTAHVTLYHDAEHPSYLKVPVVR